MKRTTLFKLTIFLIVLLPISAQAWGRNGHQIVAGIAEKYLQTRSPAALIRAKELLGGKSLMDVAVYLDDVRNKRPYTKNWHYVDIPLEEDSYVAARDCRMTNKGDCAIQALNRLGYVLSNKNEDPCARAEALKFIIHLIGDIHQPLHNIDDNDAGGNGKIVKFFDLKGYDGAPPNLHQVWDDGILAHTGKNVTQFIEKLGLQNASDISVIIAVNSPNVWVQDAHKLAQEAYQRLPEPTPEEVYILDNDSQYFDSGLPVVESQLRKAGLRLGKLLERALG